MPGPLVAAAPTVAAFITRNGVTKAIKKYGQRAVDEARKHMKDVTTKKTPGQKKIEPVTKSQRATRSTARRTAAGTAGLTAAGYEVANVDLNSGKGLPVADMSQSIDVKGDGDGMRYFQNGKEVRMPKK
jgi:hypothetical protein